MTIFDDKLATNTKFVDEDVDGTLSQLAISFLNAYTGDFDYLIQLRSQKKPLSVGQIRGTLNCILAARKNAAKAALPPVTGLRPILGLLDTALTKKIRYPKVRFEDLIIARIGDKSPHVGGANLVSRTNDYYGEATWYGRINKDGSLTRGKAMTDQMEEFLVNFAADPASVAKVYGQKFSNCCFCGKEIVTNESLAVGYGPDCAAHYGLPWGTTQEVAA